MAERTVDFAYFDYGDRQSFIFIMLVLYFPVIMLEIRKAKPDEKKKENTN
ncbi:MAG: hypothetical protein QM489_05250 [Candidatus Izemoplasma sp.]